MQMHHLELRLRILVFGYIIGLSVSVFEPGKNHDETIYRVSSTTYLLAYERSVYY